jgi:hypothetical protein
MGKRGTKRKAGERTPSGQLSRAKPQEVTVSVSQVRAHIAAKQIDGRYMTPFGLMAIDKRVTDQQYAAGLRFAGAYEAYRRAIDSPGLSVSAQNLNAIGGRDNVIEGDAEIRRARRCIAEWSRIETLLTNLEIRALERICILHHAQESFTQFRALQYGLDKLCAMWGERLT